MIRLAVLAALILLAFGALYAAKLTAIWRRQDEQIETDARARRAGV